MSKLAFIVIFSSSCAHSYIEGTQIVDTDPNRQVLDTINGIKQAMEQRDAEAILAHVSSRYFEDMGTPAADDDYGYEEFKTSVLPKSMEVTRELYLDLQIYDIVVEEEKNRAFADVRFQSRARIELPSGDQWDRHREFNRIELVKEDGAWRVTSGL